MSVRSLADATDHLVDPDKFLELDRAVREAKRIMEDASAEMSVRKKALKNSGVKPLAYTFIEKMRKLDEEEQIVNIRHVIQYFNWLEMPIGQQLSMLDAPNVRAPKRASIERQAVFEAGEAGLKAGRLGDSADTNPHQPGTETHSIWARRHAEGLTERATAAQMEDTEAERPADVAHGTGKRGRPSKASAARKPLSGATTTSIN